MDALLRLVLFPVVLPEPVSGQGGGDQGRGDRERGQPREPAEGQQRAGHQLDGAVEAHRLLGLGGHHGDPFGQRPDHRLGRRRDPVGPAKGVITLENEDGRHHGTREGSQYRHECHLPTEPAL